MMKSIVLLLALMLATAAVPFIPTAAVAQVQNVQAAEIRNARDVDALKTRISEVQVRIGEGVSSRKVTKAQARRLGRQVARVQASMSRLNRKQGFVSAAELASYNRTLGEIDVSLDGYGVPRSYRNDGLVAPRPVR